MWAWRGAEIRIVLVKLRNESKFFPKKSKLLENHKVQICSVVTKLDVGKKTKLVV